MMSRTTSTALLLGLALAATPVIAANLGGTPDESEATQESSMTLPANLKASPLPKVERDKLTRALGTEQSEETLSTLTKSRDGAVTETPPSAAVRTSIKSGK